MTSRSSSITSLLLLALSLVLFQSETSAYPIITDVDEGDTKVSYCGAVYLMAAGVSAELWAMGSIS